MKTDHLTLANGTEVCVAWDMNALGMFTMLTGKGLADLVTANRDMNLLRTVAWCSVIEGEKIEGREFALTEDEFGREMDMASVIRFSEIFTEQITRTGQKKSPAKGRAPKVLIRKR